MLKQKHSHYLQVSPNPSFNLPPEIELRMLYKFSLKILGSTNQTQNIDK